MNQRYLSQDLPCYALLEVVATNLDPRKGNPIDVGLLFFCPSHDEELPGTFGSRVTEPTMWPKLSDGTWPKAAEPASFMGYDPEAQYEHGKDPRDLCREIRQAVWDAREYLNLPSHEDIHLITTRPHLHVEFLNRLFRLAGVESPFGQEPIALLSHLTEEGLRWVRRFDAHDTGWFFDAEEEQEPNTRSLRSEFVHDALGRARIYFRHQTITPSTEKTV